jgi:hypothetical protein
MVDADACCAAAWVQLSADELTAETVERLRAIAWDCDHLGVPPDLSHHTTFAAKAVAALKRSSHSIPRELGLPQNRKEWTEAQQEAYASEAFKRGTTWLIAAAKGDRPYPGESGEADDYWQDIETDAQMLLRENRLDFLETPTGLVAVCDVHDIERSVDPRAFYHALEMLTPSMPNMADPATRPLAPMITLGNSTTPRPLRAETLTIREHRQGGTQYTLGCIPLHPGRDALDLTRGTFERLTQAERAVAPQADPWGGRRTVGGSGWNTPSHLTPEQVVACLDV